MDGAGAATNAFDLRFLRGLPLVLGVAGFSLSSAWAVGGRSRIFAVKRDDNGILAYMAAFRKKRTARSLTFPETPSSPIASSSCFGVSFWRSSLKTLSYRDRSNEA